MSRLTTNKTTNKWGKTPLTPKVLGTQGHWVRFGLYYSTVHSSRKGASYFLLPPTSYFLTRPKSGTFVPTYYPTACESLPLSLPIQSSTRPRYFQVLRNPDNWRGIGDQLFPANINSNLDTCIHWPVSLGIRLYISRMNAQVSQACCALQTAW